MTSVYLDRADFTSGTVNFTHIFPMFCVSIGFILNGEPVVGVINAPFLNQTFSACRGRGAWLNETQRLPLMRNPIPPMPDAAPKGCVFSCEWLVSNHTPILISMSDT